MRIPPSHSERKKQDKVSRDHQNLIHSFQQSKCQPKNQISHLKVSRQAQGKREEIHLSAIIKRATEAANMSRVLVKQRQRHKSSWPAATSKYSPSISVIVVISVLVVLQSSVLQNTLVNCQPQPGDGGSIFGSLTPSTSNSNSGYPQATLQYNRQRSSNNLNLVNNHQPIFAQSLPLIRHKPPQPQHLQQQQGADLDNVIESTTSLLSLQPNVVAKFVDASETSGASTSMASNCQLPPTWTGKWYQSNKEPIRITNTEISDKGVCRDQKGDKYLFEYSGVNKQHQQTSASPLSISSTSNEAPCLVCLRFIDRHLNALQYKESSCQPIPANYYNRSTQNLIVDDHSLLDSICDDINGDNPLESLFRLDTPAIECPISGQYMFTHDSCREPQSTLDSCIDKKQLNFKFSACPDVAGSESKSEVLKCYADWLDNSENDKYYMIGRLEHASNPQDKGKFRCFVYEKSSDGKFIQMASQDESCNGLISPTEGPKTLRLSVKPPTIHKCHFPSYIQSQSENWLSVDNSLIYMLNQNSTKYQVKETKEGSIIEEATCLQQFTHPHSQHLHLNQNQPLRVAAAPNQPQFHSNRRFPPSTSSSQPQVEQQQQVTARTNDAVYLVQITKNCFITNYCVRFYKRSNGIVQIDYFMHTPNSDHPCRNAYIKEYTPQTQIITSTNLEHQRCPFEGAYTIEAPIESDFTYNPSNIFVCPRQSFLTAQCEQLSRLRIHSRCSPTKNSIKNLYCLGSWTTNGLVRLLLADDERQRYSAWYKDYPVPVVQDGTISQPDGSSSQVPATRSTGLGRADPSSGGQFSANNLYAPIVDLQIALITPAPIIAKPMQVRLTRRNPCSDLRGYTNQGSYSGSGSSSMPSYAPSLTAQSSATPTVMISSAWCQAIVICSSIALLIVNSLVATIPLVANEYHHKRR